MRLKIRKILTFFVLFCFIIFLFPFYPSVYADDDITPPEMIEGSVHIESDNHNPHYLVKPGDSVYVYFETNEEIQTPSVQIAGQQAEIYPLGDNKWSASYSMTDNEEEGYVQFSIEYVDIAGNSGTPIYNTTDSSSVQFDKTVPEKPNTPTSSVVGTSITYDSAYNGVPINVPFSHGTVGDVLSLRIDGEEFSTPQDRALDTESVNQGSATITISSDAGWGQKGRKEITAVIRDLAGNESEPSDPLYLDYDNELRFTTKQNIPLGYKNIGTPKDIIWLSDGSYWYVDAQNFRIVKVVPGGIIERTIGRKGEAEGEFVSAPISLTKDNEGILYVVESEGCRVSTFDFNGGFLTRFGNCDRENYDFTTPQAIHYDASSNSLFITDAAADKNRVLNYSLSGTYLSQFGTSGTGNGQFMGPVGITTDPQGKIYVVDGDNHRVQVFSSNHTFLFTFGSNAEGSYHMNYPKDIELLSNGDIIVSSQNSQKIKRFNSQGQFILEWGSLGYGESQLRHPAYLARGGDNVIYVTDWGLKAIKKFTSNGDLLSTLRNSGEENGYFIDPGSVTYDSSGYMYVLDKIYENARIQKFTNSGEYISNIVPSGVIGSASYCIRIYNDKLYVTDSGSVKVFSLTGTLENTIGSGGTEEGKFNQARSVDFDNEGNIYVADLSNRIQKFNPSGIFISQWGVFGQSEGQLDWPVDIEIDKQTERIYIAEYHNNRISVFNLNGEFIHSIGSYGYGNDQFSQLSGIALGKSNTLYAADNNKHKVFVFDREGEFIASIGSEGSGDDQFNGVSDVAIEPSTKELVALDRENHRLESFVSGVRIKNLTPAVDVLRSEDDFSLTKNYFNPDDSSVSNISSNLYFGEYIVSDFSVDLSADRNWVSVGAFSLPNSSKALLKNLNPQTAPGVSSTHSLYVVKRPQQSSVHVCPQASTLAEVTAGCEGGYTLQGGDAGLSVVKIDGVEYWKIQNLTGTGAWSDIPTPSATPSPTSSQNPQPSPTPPLSQDSNRENNSSSNSFLSHPAAPVCSNEEPSPPQFSSISFFKKNTLTVTWVPVDKATSWTLSYGKRPGEYLFGIVDFGNAHSRSVDVGFLREGTYYFALKANNGCMPSKYSSEWTVELGTNRVVVYPHTKRQGYFDMLINNVPDFSSHLSTNRQTQEENVQKNVQNKIGTKQKKENQKEGKQVGIWEHIKYFFGFR